MSESEPSASEAAVVTQRERLDRLISAVRVARVYEYAQRVLESADAVFFMLSP